MRVQLHCLAVILSAVSALAATSASAAIYTYNLNNSLADSTGGGPSLVAEGGTLGAAGYTFGANQGLTLDAIGGAAINSYSIDIKFDFSSDITARGNGYRKIVDFSSLSSDGGLYSLNHDIDVYNAAFSAGPVLTNGTIADVLLTHSATGQVTVSVDGIQALNFADTSDITAFTPLSTLRFFRTITTRRTAKPPLGLSIRSRSRRMAAVYRPYRFQRRYLCSEPRF